MVSEDGVRARRGVADVGRTTGFVRRGEMYLHFRVDPGSLIWTGSDRVVR